MKDILLIYRGQVFDSEIQPRLEEFKDDNITLVTENKLTRNLISHLIKDYKQKVNLITASEFLDDTIITKFMKFKRILGNPPYQDGSQDGGQNKIYNQISKKALSLLDYDGSIDFTTPTSVLKKSKRFSLIGIDGLREVDFTTNDSFKEGVDICSWVVDKTYNSKDVNVFTKNGKQIQSSDNRIYDFSKVDSNFTNLYTKLKEITDDPNKRMFCQNNFGPAMKKEKSDLHIHSLYKLNKDGNVELTYWSSRVPYFEKERKISIGMTKSLNPNLIVDSYKNFDVGYMTTKIKNDSEFDNIKSFVLSDYFIEHSNKWKCVDGYGYNYALKYLPPFDKTKSWTNDTVKEFIESFLND